MSHESEDEALRSKETDNEEQHEKEEEHTDNNDVSLEATEQEDVKEDSEESPIVDASVSKEEVSSQEPEATSRDLQEAEGKDAEKGELEDEGSEDKGAKVAETKSDSHKPTKKKGRASRTKSKDHLHNDGHHKRGKHSRRKTNAEDVVRKLKKEKHKEKKEEETKKRRHSRKRNTLESALKELSLESDEEVGDKEEKSETSQAGGESEASTSKQRDESDDKQEDEEDIWGIRRRIKELNESVQHTTKEQEDERLRRIAEETDTVGEKPVKKKRLAKKVKEISVMKRKKSYTSPPPVNQIESPQPTTGTSSTTSSPYTGSNYSSPVNTWTSANPLAHSSPSVSSPPMSSNSLDSETGKKGYSLKGLSDKAKSAKLRKRLNTTLRRKKKHRSKDQELDLQPDEFEKEDEASAYGWVGRKSSLSFDAPEGGLTGHKVVRSRAGSDPRDQVAAPVPVVSLPPVQTQRRKSSEFSLYMTSLAYPPPIGLDAAEFSDDEPMTASQDNTFILKERWAEISAMETPEPEPPVAETRTTFSEYIALFNFEPEGNTELGFMLGDKLVGFSEEAEDGWLQAQHVATGEVGYIPINYVHRVGAEEDTDIPVVPLQQKTPREEPTMPAETSAGEEDEICLDGEWSESEDDTKEYAVASSDVNSGDNVDKTPSAEAHSTVTDSVDANHEQGAEADEVAEVACTEADLAERWRQWEDIRRRTEEDFIKRTAELKQKERELAEQRKQIAKDKEELVKANQRRLSESDKKKRVFSMRSLRKSKQDAENELRESEENRTDSVFFDRVPREWVSFFEAINKMLKQLKKDGDDDSAAGLTVKEIERIITGDIFGNGLTRSHQFPDSPEDVASLRRFIHERLVTGKKKSIVEIKGVDKLEKVDLETSPSKSLSVSDERKEEGKKEEGEKEDQANDNEDPRVRKMEEKVKQLDTKLKKTEKKLLTTKKSKTKQEKQLMEKMMEMRIRLNLMEREAEDEELDEISEWAKVIKEECGEDIKALVTSRRAKIETRYEEKKRKWKEKLDTMKVSHEKKEMELMKQVALLELKLEKVMTTTREEALHGHGSSSNFNTPTKLGHLRDSLSPLSADNTPTSKQKKKETAEQAATSLASDVNFVFLVSMAIFKMREQAEQKDTSKLWQS